MTPLEAIFGSWKIPRKGKNNAKENDLLTFRCHKKMGEEGGKSARRLEKLQRDFLWGGGNLERKAHLVNWETVCVDKEKGGLGIRKLTLLNKALLGKWIWRFACAKEDLWKQVLMAKYGQEDFGWRTKKAFGAFGVGVWKEILKEAGWCWEKLAFKVGKGTKIRFWTDLWCGGTVLS